MLRRRARIARGVLSPARPGSASTTLARAHARSGDAVAIASYLGSSQAFDQAMAAFAEAYADQNERDFRVLQAAVASGRMTADLAA